MSAVTETDIKQEAQRLFEILGKITDFKTGLKYDEASCLALAPLTLQINTLKKQQNAVILSHYYCTPDIVYGVADYRGDSYALSKKAGEVKEDIIIFCGVYFMAETMKIINPQKRVFLPPVTAGCSLAESVNADDVKALRQKYPAARFVCYINSTAEVKAQCDVCVTSSNAYDICAGSRSSQLVFLPDVFMAGNIKNALERRGIAKQIIPFGGTCCVHDRYMTQDVQELRKKHPNAKIICHPECAPAVSDSCDYTGSTGGMLKYAKESPALEFAVLSEDGILNCLEYENPQKSFIRATHTCAQMKRNALQNILAVLQNPQAAPQVQVEPAIAAGAKKCIDAMFEEAAK